MKKDIVIHYNPLWIFLFVLVFIISILYITYNQISILNNEILSLKEEYALNLQVLSTRINELESKALLNSTLLIKSPVQHGVINLDLQRDLLKYFMIMLGISSVICVGYFGISYFGYTLGNIFPIKLMTTLNSSLLYLFNSGTGTAYEFIDPSTNYTIKVLIEGDICKMMIKIPGESCFKTLGAVIDITTNKTDVLTSQEVAETINHLANVIF